MKIEIFQLTCKRCNHKWIPRKTEVRVCPSCHSPFWDRERTQPGAVKASIQDVLKEMVRRIVEIADPQKIILFGSHATGQAAPGSDVDLMVVTSKGESKRQMAVELYRALRGVGVAKDIVVVRPESFERYRDIIGTIIYPAAHKGKILYERAA